MLYTNQTKVIIRQLCRFPDVGIPTMTLQQWNEIFVDVFEAKCGLDVFRKEDTGEVRLIIHKKTGKMWKVAKIDNDVLYFTDGTETISENQLIYRYNMLPNGSKTRIINIG
jgi:hypothetical protein